VGDIRVLLHRTRLAMLASYEDKTVHAIRGQKAYRLMEMVPSVGGCEGGGRPRSGRPKPLITEATQRSTADSRSVPSVVIADKSRA
jgi:hypothetical protein